MAPIVPVRPPTPKVKLMLPRSRSVFSSSVQLRASFFLSLSSSCAGSVSARVGRGQRGYVPSFRRTCTRTRPRSRVPRAAASSGSASRLGGRGRGRPVWERGSAATRQRSDRDAFEGREMKGWAYGTRTHLSLLNFDDTSRRVSLLREHRRVHFRRRLIVVDPALCELLLLLYVSPVGESPLPARAFATGHSTHSLGQPWPSVRTRAGPFCTPRS